MLITEWNMDEALKVREEEGVARGRREGIKKGQREMAIKTAIALKAKGMEVDTIAEITGLFVDDILRL